MRTLVLAGLLLLQGNEAALRARIAELEKQVKALEAKLGAQTPASGWKTLATWKGSGIKTTESFTTKSGEWRVQWKSSGGGVLQVMVYDARRNLVTLAANTMAAGSDVSYVRANPGSFYLTINSANTNWEVTVEEK